MQSLTDKIEILSVELLNQQRQLVEEMRSVGAALDIGLGWHYLLDLSWAARQMAPSPPLTVLDAGAGLGIMQWWLAAKGVDVLSVDRRHRAELKPKYRAWATVNGLRPTDLQPLPSSWPGFKAFLPSRNPANWSRWPAKVTNAWQQATVPPPSPPGDRGKVTFYNQDLGHMPDIPDDSVDVVVSISALEHNAPDDLKPVVQELLRVLKPGGRLIATLGAAKNEVWFHEASKGWCYTESVLRDVFDLPDSTPSNYNQYDALFTRLKNCAELRENLAPFYYKSANNGMPWGVWEPQYQPVGVVKVKRAS